MANRKPRTVMERRAAAFCADWPEAGRTFGLRWVPSRTWGRVARIDDWNGEVCARASGYGYCKRSACLAELLSWLPEVHCWLPSGDGVDAVRGALAAVGWRLDWVYQGRDEDAFTLRRAAK